MTIATQMLDTYPNDLSHIDKAKLAACIDGCLECGQACTACADACLSEEMVAELTDCIRTNIDCSDICFATANILSRVSGHETAMTRVVLEACRAACNACAVECERH